MPPGPSATLSDVRAAAEVSRQVTTLLSSAGDRRGVFGVGLDAVEERAVIPFEEHSSQWAQVLSANLIYRYLSAVHAEFSGGEVPQHWARYFDSGVTMAGYNAHLSVDLAPAVADSGARPDNYDEYLRIVGAIADTVGLIVERTQSAYGDNLVPLWEAAAIPVGHEGREKVVRIGDQAFSSISFANGLGLERAESRAASQAAVQSLWQSVDAVIVRNLESSGTCSLTFHWRGSAMSCSFTCWCSRPTPRWRGEAPPGSPRNTTSACDPGLRWRYSSLAW